MSDIHEHAQARPTSNASRIAVGAATVATLGVVFIVGYGFSALQDSPTPRTTMLEQNAGDLKTANVEICGMTASTLSTGHGLFRLTPTDVDILNHIKAVRHSVIEIAFQDDNIHLIGEANTSASVYYCQS